MFVLHRFVRPFIGLARQSIGRRIARRNLGLSAFKPLIRHSIETGYAGASRELVWRVFRQPPRRLPTFSILRAAQKSPDIAESETSETILATTEFEPTPALHRDARVDTTTFAGNRPWTRVDTQPDVEPRKPSRPMQIQTKVEELTTQAVSPASPERASRSSPEKTPLPEGETFESPATPIISTDEQISQPMIIAPEPEPSAVAPPPQTFAIETWVELPQRGAISSPHIESSVTAKDGAVSAREHSIPPKQTVTNVAVTSPEIKQASTPPTVEWHPFPIIGSPTPREGTVNQRDKVMQQPGSEATRLLTRRLAPHVRLPVTRQSVPAKQISHVAARESSASPARMGDLVHRPGLPKQTERGQGNEPGKPLTLVRPPIFSRQTKLDQSASPEMAERFDQGASAEITESKTRATWAPTSEIAHTRDIPSSLSSPLTWLRYEMSDGVPAQIQRESPMASADPHRPAPRLESEEPVPAIQEKSFGEESLVENKHLTAPPAFDALSIQGEPVEETASATPMPSSREAPSPTAGASPASAGLATQVAPGVDLDTMARLVYQILRRRLRVELERSRGGSG